MMTRYARAGILALICVASAAGADEPIGWPQFLGPTGDLHARGLEVTTGPLALETVWSRSLGSGYSQIVVQGDELYTMFSDGTQDVVVALNSRTGTPRWRRPIGATWRGLLGSRDGPLSTPALHGELVFALGPRGQLFALRRADGGVQWKVDLLRDYHAETPQYGFATSPLVVGAQVLVQAGAPQDRSMMAFQAKDGTPLWSTGSDFVSYQSPALVTLAGETQVVSVTDTLLRGLSLESGDVLWEELQYQNPVINEHGRVRLNDGSSHVVATGPNRFLVTTWKEAIQYEISREENRYQVRERWRTQDLKSSYAIPIYHDGHLYGYSLQFLTCIDAETGERAWKSRPPGKGETLLLDDLLVVWAIDGSVTVLPASPEGYAEITSGPVLEVGSLVSPSFAEGMLFVRNHEEIAAVRLVSATADAQLAETTSRPATAGTFEAFLQTLSGGTDRAGMVDRFLADQENLPLIGTGGQVHFLYRGDAEDVGIFVGRVKPWRRSDPMAQIPGTNLWHRTYGLSPGGRYDYAFQVNFETLKLDAMNPRTAPSFYTASELAMPGWSEPAHLREPAAGSRGTVETLELRSSILDDERTIDIYLPHGYAGSERSYPLLLVGSGPAARQLGLMTHTLDNLIGKSVEPVIVGFIPYVRTLQETAGEYRDAYIDMLLDELLPLLRDRYRIVDRHDRVFLMGTDLAGYSSIYAILKRPEAFGGAAAQSIYSANRAMMASLTELLQEQGGAGPAIYMDWTTRERIEPDNDIDVARDNRELAALLEENGYNVTRKEVASGPGWGTWRSRTDAVLETLLPLE
jgi:enterochelin esterase-like enzyme/outer membrane protein assembly factor BamB